MEMMIIGHRGRPEETLSEGLASTDLRSEKLVQHSGAGHYCKCNSTWAIKNLVVCLCNNNLHKNDQVPT